jgi:hypothetical protein
MPGQRRSLKPLPAFLNQASAGMQIARGDRGDLRPRVVALIVDGASYPLQRSAAISGQDSAVLYRA